MEKLRINKEEKELMAKEILKQLESCNRLSDFKLDLKEVKNVMKPEHKPIIQMSAEVYTKMYTLVHESPIEISWHGLVNRDKENDIYTIYDILMFPQINGPTTTATEDEEFAEWMTELIMDPEFPINDLRMHGHSHVNMQVFSSGVDDAYQKELIAKVENDDYYLFLVLNKKQEMCVLLYDFNRQILFHTEDVEVRVVSENCDNILEWARENIKEYCKKEVAPVYKYGGRGKKGKPQQVVLDELDDYEGNYYYGRW